MATTVDRKVHFYRARFEIDGQNGKEHPESPDPTTICDALRKLKFTNKERYLDLGNGQALSVWPRANKTHPRLEFGNIRSTGLPQLERGGVVTPLVIEDDQGLLERTHVMFFANDIVGAEFNSFGPRLTRLTQYLASKCPNFGTIHFDPLFNMDVWEQINHAKDLRLIQLRVRRDKLILLKEASASMFDSLDSMGEELDAPVVEIIIRTPPHSRKPLGGRAMGFVKEILGVSNVGEHLETFKIRGKDDRTDRVEWFDLLEDQFVSARKVVKEAGKHRAIDSTSMY